MGNCIKKQADIAVDPSDPCDSLIVPNDPHPAAKVLVALYPYESRADGDLSFAKADNMVLLCDINPDWWFVENMRTRQKGYIPRNYVARQQTLECEEWYVGKVPRRNSELIVLQGNLPAGSFLIRQRDADETEFVLTINDTDPVEDRLDSVKHYKIRQMDTGGRVYITTTRTFDTLQDMVQHYMGLPDGLCCKLTFPAPRIDPEPNGLNPIMSKNWEIPKSELQQKRKLGAGNFGEVWSGKWRGVVNVAIKRMKPNTMSPEAFLREAAIMKQCNHPNLVKLYGVCSSDEPLFIVTEFMINGSLLQFLKGKSGQYIQFSALIDTCAQVANGMFYLEERRMVHRDLAARNVLVGRVTNCGIPVIKVADFGLARMLVDPDQQVYRAHEGTRFPIKWTAPEAANTGTFTVKSDVWSYGILLYEVITKCKVPYADLGGGIDVIHKIRQGYRIPCPVEAPAAFYEIMLACWAAIPDKRPTFDYLHNFFNDYFVSTEPNYVASL